MRCIYLCKWVIFLKPWHLFFLILNIGFVNGQIPPKGKNHVVLLIDRSAEMEPQKGELIWDDIFEHLNTICFDSINGKRPLLIPNHDYLSIVSFGKNYRNSSEAGLNNYITTDDFGFTYKNEFSLSALDNFKSDINRIGWRERDGGFFCYTNGYPSIAISYTVRFLGIKFENQEFQNTYLIRITDRVPNIGNSEISEIHHEGPRTVNETLEVKTQLNKNYVIIRENNYSEEFLREEDNNERSGEKYYVDFFLLEPKRQVIYDNIITQNPVLELTRFPDKYVGELTIEHQPNEDFKTERLDVVYTVNDKVIKKDSIRFSSEKNTYSSIIEMPVDSYEADTKVDFYLTAQYKNDFYPGTVVSGYQNENLSKQLNITFDPKSKILGFIPLSDSMFSFLGKFGVETQSKAGTVVIIIFFTLFIILFMLLIKYIASRTYQPTAVQFDIKEREH